MIFVYAAIIIIIGVLVGLSLWGRSLRKKKELSLQEDMKSWLAGDELRLDPNCSIWKTLVETNFYYETHDTIDVTRWSSKAVEVHAIDGRQFFVSLESVLMNVSLNQRRIEAEMKAFQKTEEERKTLNPETLVNDISIYTMNREQLEAALAQTNEEERYELSQKITNVIKDKYDTTP